MARPPHRPTSARDKAEAAFKSATTRPAEPLPRTTTIPTGKELVSLRIDRDVLAHFQDDGPGWQERINAALREAAGLD
ncbi:BrnA antitoxin family protein [Pelagibacterium montanilacus]|uniref:BrnA antitoxin family protein n=1 Tax=Pelagibacterium montanilacus TaxID=2185280 RepID=UPI000F8EA48C|nr:BrnA antitoxin family protein [Pelagibacterium montanilacus]